MRKKTSIALGLAMVLGTAGFLFAQRQRVSPHETVNATIGGKKITIEYGRPYKKGRNLWADPIAPYGKVWRAGADEATKLTTDADLMIGSVHVPAGKYSLFAIPGEKQWTLVVNKVADQWGAFKYDQTQDLGRTSMKVETAPETEQFTIAIEPKGGSNATLRMTWGTVSATAPIMVH